LFKKNYESICKHVACRLVGAGRFQRYRAKDPPQVQGNVLRVKQSKTPVQQIEMARLKDESPARRPKDDLL
jgi:hypothetical protein